MEEWDPWVLEGSGEVALMAESEEELKSLLMKVKVESAKVQKMILMYT